MDDLVASFENLSLSTLPKQWVEDIVFSEYQEFTAYPKDYLGPTNGNLLNTLENILHTYDEWLQNENEDFDKDWTTLSKHVNPKEVLVLLGSYLYNGVRNAHEETSRYVTIIAARIYFKLIRLPQQVFYNIYHEQLFLRALACFRFVSKTAAGRDVAAKISKLIPCLDIYVSDLQETIMHLGLKVDAEDMDEVVSGLLDANLCAAAQKYCDSPLITPMITVIQDLINVSLQDPECDLDKAMSKIFHKFYNKISVLDNKHGHNFVCESYMRHIEYLVANYEVLAVISLLSLMENLAFHHETYERAEVKSMRIVVVIMFFRGLPAQNKQNFLNWILKLSKVQTVPNRQMALELIYNMLMDPTDLIPVDDPPEPPPDPPPAPPPAPLPAPLPPPVSIYDDPQPSTSRAPVSFEVPSQEPVVNRVTPNNNRSYVSHESLLNVLVNHICDNSSFVRSKVLVMLGELLNAQNEHTKAVVDKLYKSEVSPVNIAMRMMKDSRAAVRKASIVLIQKIIAKYPEVIHDQLIEHVVTACRDVCYIVRSTAILLIYGLCKQSNEAFIKTYMTGPMLQIFDHNSKLQILVAGHIEALLLTPLAECGSMKSNTPWLFMSILVNGLMDSVLEKAFRVLSDNRKLHVKQITSVLKTYLMGKEVPNEHKVYSLKILAEMSSCLPPKFDATFIVDFYYSLAAERDDMLDMRVIRALFELLLRVHKYIPKHVKERFRKHLIETLENGEWNAEGCRILCANLVLQLNPNDISWAVQIYRQYESLFYKGAPVIRWIALADFCQVSKITPNDTIVNVFSRALSPTRAPHWDGCIVVALGRIAAASRVVAVRVNSIYTKILSAKNVSTPIKINALNAIADMASNHVGILEAHLPAMCKILSDDPSSSLRQTLSKLLTQLQLNGYAKLKRPIVYRYWLLMFDSDETVSGHTQYYFKTYLDSKIIYNMFLQCVLDFNNYSEVESGLFPETISETLRFLLYEEMLARLSPKQKWALHGRFGEDVFNYATFYVDKTKENFGLPAALVDVIMESIKIFLGPMKTSDPEVNAESAANTEDEGLEKDARKSMLNKMKMSGIEKLVSSVINLLTELVDTTSPLVPLLSKLVHSLLKSNKSEIAKISEDNIDFDVRLKEYYSMMGITPPVRNSTRPRRAASTGTEPSASSGPNPPEAEAPATPRSSRSSRPRTRVRRGGRSC